MHASTIAETLVKIGSVVVEIFGEIGRFLLYRFKSTNFSHLNLWRYRTKIDHICTRCRGIICAIHLLMQIAIFNSVLKCQGAEWSLGKFCPKSVAIATSLKESKRGPDRENSCKYLSFREKIVKIGPVDPETRNARQCLAYSPLGAAMSPLASSREPKPCFHLANVQRMHVVSVCLYNGKIIWLSSNVPVTNWKIRYKSIICT